MTTIEKAHKAWLEWGSEDRVKGRHELFCKNMQIDMENDGRFMVLLRETYLDGFYKGFERKITGE